MLRTFVLAAAAAVGLACAALSPTAASAHGYRGWHGWHHQHVWRGPRAVYRAPFYAAYNPCLRRRWVPTPWGPRLRVINVCY